MTLQFSTLAVVYLLPVVLAASLLAWHWFRTPAGQSWLEPAIIGLPIVVGFCGLERRWPWELHSPWRLHYGIAAGLMAMILVASLYAGRRRLCRVWAPIGVVFVSGGGLFLLLGKFADRLHNQWSDQQHFGLLAVLLLLAAAHQLGQIGLTRVLPAPWFLMASWILLCGGALYAFFAASSLKVAQWMTIGAAVSGSCALPAFLHRRHCLPGVGAVVGFFFSGVLLYGFYAAEDAILLPVLALLGAALGGLPWAFREPERGTRRRAAIALLCMGLGVATAIAIVLGHLSTAEDGEDDPYAAYGSAALSLGNGPLASTKEDCDHAMDGSMRHGGDSHRSTGKIIDNPINHSGYKRKSHPELANGSSERFFPFHA